MDKSKFLLACFIWFKGLIDAKRQCSNLLRLAAGQFEMQEESKLWAVLSQMTTDCYFGMLSLEIWIRSVYDDILELPREKKSRYSLTAVNQKRQKKPWPAKEIHKLHYVNRPSRNWRCVARRLLLLAYRLRMQFSSLKAWQNSDFKTNLNKTPL